MALLAVGDLHGQVHLAERALATGHKVLFIGDYVDSFTLSGDDCARTFRIVLEAVESGKAIALWGNHDLQYFDPQHRCGGYNLVTQSLLTHIGAYRAYKSLDFWRFEEGFLFTHGGLTNSVLLTKNVTWEEYLANHKEHFHVVGRGRGGRGLPGIVWCDWRTEFFPVPGLKQIFGHSRGNGIREIDGNYCIDCLEDTEPQGLLVEDGKAIPYNF